MPAGLESNVQVAPNSTGAKIRNVQLDLAQADGSIATVMMQVVGIRDEHGEAVRGDADLLTAIYQELRALRVMYGRATGMGMAALSAQSDDSSDF